MRRSTRLTIVSINGLAALQRMERATGSRMRANSISYARDCGAKALVAWCPVNDAAARRTACGKPTFGRRLGAEADARRGRRDRSRGAARLRDLFAALQGGGRRSDPGSLGFKSSFRLVHDTFHHPPCRRKDQFFCGSHRPRTHLRRHRRKPGRLGYARSASRSRRRPPTGWTIKGQIRRLRDEAYAGPFSFEPFAPSVHGLADPADALRESMDYLPVAELIANRQWKELDSKPARPGALDGIPIKWNTYSVMSKHGFFIRFDRKRSGSAASGPKSERDLGKKVAFPAEEGVAGHQVEEKNNEEIFHRHCDGRRDVDGRACGDHRRVDGALRRQLS